MFGVCCVMARSAEEATPYSGRNRSKWNRVRAVVLERDGGTCQIRSNCDGAPATEVDHVTPWRDGGAWFELENLRAACKACNISRAAKQKHRDGWRRAATEIVVVDRGAADSVSPERGDVVVDIGRLAEAVAADVPTPGHHEVAAMLFGRLVAWINRGDLDVARVWIVAESDDVAAMLPQHSRITGGGDSGHGQRAGHAVEPGRW